MKQRIAVIDGIRTPFCKAGGALKDTGAADLGAYVVKELLFRNAWSPEDVDEVIFGNVAQPSDSANIARIIALKAQIPIHVPAFTVHRNCASGMESVSSAINLLLLDRATTIIAGGTESMSQIPLIFNKKMTKLFERLFRARSFFQKLKIILSFRPSFLAPVVALQKGLFDPICNLNMGETAEVLAREFKITREEQDLFALNSHLKAAAAQHSGRFGEEIVPIPVAPNYDNMQSLDDSIRSQQTLDALKKLKPCFNRDTGTVTAGNTCPITDGAAALLLMREDLARKRGLEPLGYIVDYAYAGLEGERMGLGPVYATAKLFDRCGWSLKDLSLIEMNEAFAVQILANLKAFSSAEFAKKYLKRETPLGEVRTEILNVNGGAIALGHPVGTSGTRLLLTLLKELHLRGGGRGLATLCIGGGQGAAFAVEVGK